MHLLKDAINLTICIKFSTRACTHKGHEMFKVNSIYIENTFLKSSFSSLILMVTY